MFDIISKLLNQEVALVTGAASGIGLDIAEIFAAEGARVVLSVLEAEKAEEVFNPLIPQYRLLQVEENADYAVFLASDKAKGVTGQAVVLDGGYVAQ